MKSTQALGTILILITLTSCNNIGGKQEKAILVDDDDPIMSRVVSRAQNAQKRLNGSVFDYFPTIDISSGPAILLVYNNNDCNTCIQIGIDILKDVSLTSSNISSINVYNTSTDFSIDNFRPAFETTTYDLLTDRHPKPSVLTSIPTPFLMILEEGFRVKMTFFPISGIAQEDQIQSFYNHLN